jgi:hypothetical protein
MQAIDLRRSGFASAELLEKLDTRQLARCLAQGTDGNPTTAGSTPEEVHDAIGEDVAACMKQAGYRHDLADAQCIDDVDFNVHCYTKRRHWGAR